MKAYTLSSLVLTGLLLASMLMVGLTSSASYNPWYDLDDDGDIDIFDIVKIAKMYGTTGEPFVAKGAIAYDSGWVDITDKCGQHFSVPHDLNSTDMIVDITGKTTEEGGVHRRYALTGHSPSWNITYGGSDMDRAQSLTCTADGGLAIAGFTTSPNITTDGFDFWLIRTDQVGYVQFAKTYGSTSVDVAESVIQTSDGGYALAGYASLQGHDFWLVKVNATGNMDWNHAYGGLGWDEARSVAQTRDGGYILAGQVESNGNWYDVGLFKVNSAGDEEWNITWGGQGWEETFSVVQTSDEGYVATGRLLAPEAVLLLRVDSGSVTWNMTWSGASGYSVVETNDGGYAIACSGSVNLVKTDSTGRQLWNRTYSGADARSIIETSEGGYVLAGVKDGDCWLVETDSLGNVQQEYTWGGDGAEVANCVVETSDGGFAIAGVTKSYGAGDDDFALYKTETWTSESGLVWTDSTLNEIRLYRGRFDFYWNYVRVRIWKIKETQ
jgi:hypothetical protein